MRWGATLPLRSPTRIRPPQSLRRFPYVRSRIRRIRRYRERFPGALLPALGYAGKGNHTQRLVGIGNPLLRTGGGRDLPFRKRGGIKIPQPCKGKGGTRTRRSRREGGGGGACARRSRGGGGAYARRSLKKGAFVIRINAGAKQQVGAEAAGGLRFKRERGHSSRKPYSAHKEISTESTFSLRLRTTRTVSGTGILPGANDSSARYVLMGNATEAAAARGST